MRAARGYCSASARRPVDSCGSVAGIHALSPASCKESVSERFHCQLRVGARDGLVDGGVVQRELVNVRGSPLSGGIREIFAEIEQLSANAGERWTKYLLYPYRCRERVADVVIQQDERNVVPVFRLSPTWAAATLASRKTPHVR